MQTIDLIIKRGTMEAYLATRLVLFLLATRLGTLLICGTESLVSSWPFVEKFSELSLEKRERVLQKQFRNWFFTPIRAAFVYIKVAFLFCFFSRVFLKSSVFHYKICLQSHRFTCIYFTFCVRILGIAEMKH